MRRRAGLGAIQQQQLAAEKYKDKGAYIQESQIEQMSKQMGIFRQKLEDFAINHKQDIKKNSEFRKQFQEMCAAIGVDPLASGKGFWSVLGMGDYYYELSVQVVEVCLAANHKTGNFMVSFCMCSVYIERNVHFDATGYVTDSLYVVYVKYNVNINGNNFMCNRHKNLEAKHAFLPVQPT